MTLLRRFYASYLHRYLHWYALGVAFLVATNVLTVAIPGFVQHAIDALSAGHGPDSAVPWAWAILGAGAGIVVVRTLSRTLFFNPGRTVEFRVKNALFDHLLELPRRFYDRMRAGEIISRGTNDTNSVRALAGFATLQLFNVVLVLVLTFGRMVMLDPLVTAVCGLPLLGAAFILRYAIRALFKLAADSQRQIATLSDRILESYNAVAVVQAFGAGDGARARFDADNRELLDLSLAILRIRVWLLPIVGVVGSLSIVLLLVYGGRRVAAGAMSVGEIAAFAVYINILVGGLTSLGWLVNAVQRGWIGLQRVYEVLDADVHHAPPTALLPAEGPAGHPLHVRGLTFAYPEDPEARPALRDVSFTVRPGEVVGVFGLTGAGKSTLLDVLARVHDPPPGTVLLGDVDVREVPVRDWWRHVAYVTQEPFLFSRTVHENIALSEPRRPKGEAADDPRLMAAVRDAALDADLEALADGLDTVVGERGITLSGGQRQRTALARAFHRDFSLLLLDDVMSAVDHATERRLVDALYRRLRGRAGGDGAAPGTALIVSHRVSVLRRADRVLVLDGGRLVAEGTHDELCRRDPDGPYAHAVALQRAEARLEDLDRAPPAEVAVGR